MKITIYELLGLIIEGKAPKTIKYNDYIWTLRKQFNDYWNDISYLITNGFEEWENSKNFLNETIEIIEEEKEIEKIIIKDMKIQAQSTGNYCYSISQPMKIIINKLNEVIDTTKKLEKNLKEQIK